MIIRKSFILAGIIVFMTALSLYGRAVAAPASAKPKTSTVTLTRGMADVVDVPGAVADVMVADPQIVDVSALQSNKLYLVGLNYGTTNVLAVDQGGNIVSRMNIHVKMDDSAIQQTVRELFPEEKVKVSATADQVILSGQVSTPDNAQKIANMVGQYVGEVQNREGTPDQLVVNMLKVAGEQQVMLRVKIAEVSRDVLRELGVETNFDATGALEGGVRTAIASGLTATPLGVANIIFNNGSIGPLQAIIRALEDKGFVNTLAEPNLTAISGEQAGFLAGGEVPVPTSRDRDGNVMVTYHPFGVSLNFKPVVMSNNRISLQLNTEVSSLSGQNDQNVNQLVVPAFSVRRADTTVEMASGGSLMIAGLLQSQLTKGMNDLPGVGDIPILGALASSKSFQRQETELVVIVTAFLVKPYADKNNAQVVSSQPEKKKKSPSPLESAFIDNIQRVSTDKKLPKNLMDPKIPHGYIVP